MRRSPDPVLRRRRRGALLALLLTATTVVGGSTVALAAPLAPSGPAVSGSRSITEYRLANLYFSGKGASKTSTVGNGGSLVLSGAYRVRWWGKQAAPHLKLQRKVGSGSWRTTSAKVRLTDDGIVTRTPKYSTSATVRTVSYRIVSSAYRSSTMGGVRTTSRSHVVKVAYENQQRYTGLARAVYEYAKPYCPNTAVHVSSLRGGTAGDYATGTLLIRAIPAVAGYDPINVRALALHECSHERQWLNYGGTSAGHRKMEKAAATFFSDWTMPAGAPQPPYRVDPPASSITPIEHAADCGAQALNPGGYLGYGGYCTAGELAAGQRLLLGKRY